MKNNNIHMAAKKTTKTEVSGAKVGIGIGLTAAALAAAGAYFLVGSKDAAKNRAKVKGWTLKAKGEVLEALEKAKSITPDEYNELVETAVKAYGTVKEATKGEIKDFKSEMLEHWNKLEKNKAVKKMVSGAKGTAKAAKKVVK
jgi:hypothetical protein